MRIALGISYAGQRYSGWQSQACGQAVQDHLEAALARFAGRPVSTVCAGRTDAGVHGLMQVVHFDTPLHRDENSWVRGPNAFLPTDIAVQWAQQVPDSFHARACAIARRYVYVLLESPVRPSVEAHRVGWTYRPLDEQALRDAAQRLIGEHDFTSFRASACQALSPVKYLRRIDITRRAAGTDKPGDMTAPGNGSTDAHRTATAATRYWRFEFEANAFLHHMIRNIMGSLIAVGHGSHGAPWIDAVLAARSRAAAAPTFSAAGLYFAGPVYEDHWALPKRTASYDWLP